jgi:maltoporin
MKKAERVLKYLNGTRELGLRLSASRVLAGDGAIDWVDASFAVHGYMRSHTGTSISAGKGCFYAKASNQKLNNKSSTEAELIGVSDSLPT